MGDHRPEIKIQFEMHGHKANFNFGYCNWSDNGDGIDQRIVDWFEEQSRIAIGVWREGIYEAEKEQRDKDKAARELEELKRLKDKYERRGIIK